MKRVLLLQNSALETFGAYSLELEERGIQTTLIRVFAGEIPPNPSSWDAMIVGGTPLPALRIESDRRLAFGLHAMCLAIDANVPCFGVCCGGQMLARLLGGRVTRLPEMEIGSVVLRLTEAGRHAHAFRGFPDHFPTFQWHSDVFEPPDRAAVLVEGGAWPVQAFEYGGHLGVLFHLEYGEHEISRWADAYRGELATAGISRHTLLTECAANVERMQELARKLVGNFMDGV